MDVMRAAFSLPAMMVAAFALAGCDAQTAPAEHGKVFAPRPVLVERVAYEDSVPERRFVGTIRPRIESDLGFRVQGKVAKRLVNVGDIVSSGQPLATLDETDLRLQVEQAEAERQAAVTAVAQADADLKRTTSLAAKGWTAAATVDRQKSTTEEARSRLLRTDRALHLAKNSSTYTVLSADADGVVTATMAEPGQVLSPGQAAIRLAHTAEREAVVALPEAFVARAREDKATLSLWSNDKVRCRAKLRELSPAADTMTRTFLARFTILDADDAVRLGMTATVTLADPKARRLARLPLQAIFDQGKGPSVWTVDRDGKLVLKPVEVARYEAQAVLVSEGVAEGERVVKLGAQKLDPKLPVKVVDALEF